MARTRTVNTRFKKLPSYRRTFIKAWRDHRRMSQAKLAERVADAIGKEDFSHASVGRIENGKQPYSQPILEAMADALQTDVASLLMRDPTSTGKMWSLWDQAKPGEQEVIEDFAETYLQRRKKTGT